MPAPSSQQLDVRQAFKEILMPLVNNLHRVAFELCRSSSDAEDLVAETVVRACQSYATLRDATKAKQWLLRILTNTFISTRRLKKIRQEVPYDEGDGSFSLFEELAPPSSQWGNPEREVINKFLNEDIDQALHALPEEFRVAVVLCDVEGYTYDEIAQTLDIPVGTVRSRLSRGRSILQKQLYHHAVERGWTTPTKLPKRKSNDKQCECE